jgi:hypothetical protein
MGNEYPAITIILAAMVAFSRVGKIRHDPRTVRVIHEVIGVPLGYFPLLAACELGGARPASWHLVASTGHGGGHPRGCIPSARRRCQRHWACRLHAGGRRGSATALRILTHKRGS